MPATDNVKLGVCSVLFDGVDLGYTKGGVEVEVTTSTKPITVDQLGETPIGEVIMGRSVQATVPLAETTLDNLVATMPGSELVTDGAKATGTVTFVTAAPVNTDKITLAGVDYTFKTTPVGANDMAIPATITAAATALAAKINSNSADFTATVAGAVVTIRAKNRGTAGNVTLAKTAVTTANITVSGAALTGGVNTTKAQVKVSTGVNINLLSLAKVLILRPKGTSGEDDFTIFRAATPGGINYAYQFDNERVFSAVFKGYAGSDNSLFAVGDVTA